MREDITLPGIERRLADHGFAFRGITQMDNGEFVARAVRVDTGTKVERIHRVWWRSLLSLLPASEAERLQAEYARAEAEMCS